MPNNFDTISDEFWEIIHPLIPEQKRTRRKYVRKEGGGRKNLDFRQVFCGILYVLKTGCQWKAVPKQFGSSSSIHRYFSAWKKAKFFDKIWKLGLIIYDEMKGVAWECQIIDASHHKTIRTIESSGKSPVDRGKKWKQIAFNYGCEWYPISNHRNFR